MACCESKPLRRCCTRRCWWQEGRQRVYGNNIHAHERCWCAPWATGLGAGLVLPADVNEPNLKSFAAYMVDNFLVPEMAEWLRAQRSRRAWEKWQVLETRFCRLPLKQANSEHARTVDLSLRMVNESCSQFLHDNKVRSATMRVSMMTRHVPVVLRNMRGSQLRFVIVTSKVKQRGN